MKVIADNICSRCLTKEHYSSLYFYSSETYSLKTCRQCGSDIITKTIDVPYEIWRVIMKYCDKKTVLNLSWMHPEIYAPTHTLNNEIMDLIFGRETIDLFITLSLPPAIYLLLLFARFMKHGVQKTVSGYQVIAARYYTTYSNNDWMQFMEFDKKYMIDKGKISYCNDALNIAGIFKNNLMMSRVLKDDENMETICVQKYIKLVRRLLCKNCDKMWMRNDKDHMPVSIIDSYEMTFCDEKCKNTFNKQYKNACIKCNHIIYCTECCLQTDCKKCRAQSVCNRCKALTCSVCGKTDINYYELSQEYYEMFNKNIFCSMPCMMKQFTTCIASYRINVEIEHENAKLRKKEAKKRVDRNYGDQYDAYAVHDIFRNMSNFSIGRNNSKI